MSDTIAGAFILKENSTGEDLLQIFRELDFPVYQFYCPCTNKDATTPNHSCNYCLLGLKGYTTYKPDARGQHAYHPLPATPLAIKRWLCLDHQEEICDKNCDTFLEATSRFLVWEWNTVEKKFKEKYSDSWHPLAHGYYRKEGKKEEESRITETRLRRNRGRPYSAENSKARKTLAKEQ